MERSTEIILTALVIALGAVALTREAPVELFERDGTLVVRAHDAVLLSGWTIAGIPLPDAVESFKTGVVNPTEPVVLRAGEEADLFERESPVGASYRATICTPLLESRDYESYAACVKAHAGDKDFLTPVWKLSLGATLPKGTLILRDEKGQFQAQLTR